MKTINKIKSIMLIAFLAISSMFTLNSCKDDDVVGVALHSFGPTPVLRGETIRIIGSDLGKVNKVIFPNNVEVTAFESQESNEIVVTVPQEAIPGHIKIAFNGGEIESKSNLTFKEPISVDAVSPLSVKAGDIITVTGDYLYNIASVSFANGVEVAAADFVKHDRKELQITIPAAATSGKITFSDGANVPTLIEYKEPLIIAVATYTGISATNVKEGDQITITGTNLDLIEKVTFPGEIDAPFTVATDHNSLSTTVPVGTCSGVISLTQYSGATLSTEEFKVPTISCSDIDPKENITTGTKMTITGSNLQLVATIKLPGDVMMQKGSWTVGSNGSTLSFTMPKDVVDGKIVLVQNANISAETPAIKMKKEGNIFWSGNVNLGNWGSFLQIEGDDLALFKDFEAGGLFTINFEEDMSSTWWQLRPLYRDWATPFDGVKDNNGGIVAQDQGATSFTFKLTAKDVENMKATGMVISGCFCIIKSLEYSAPK